MKMRENAAQTPESPADVETGILRDVMADGLRRFEEALQSMADAEPSAGSDGRRLRRARRIGMEVDTSFGKARISVVCGQCKSTRGWETPFRDRLFRGGRGAVSPALERKAVTTVCETGSFEKAAKVCGARGCEPGDDKAMATIRRVGDACDPAMLPKLCGCAAGEDDTLIAMTDGWLARFKEAGWGNPKAPRDERVSRHEAESAATFRLSRAAEASRGAGSRSRSASSRCPRRRPPWTSGAGCRTRRRGWG